MDEAKVIVDESKETKETLGQKLKKHKQSLVAIGLVVGTAVATVAIDRLLFNGRVAQVVTEVAEEAAPFD